MSKDDQEECGIRRTLHKAALSLQELDDLSQKQGEISKVVAEHLTEAKPVVDQLLELNNKVEQLERYVQYLQWLQEIEEIRYYMYMEVFYIFSTFLCE